MSQEDFGLKAWADYGDVQDQRIQQLQAEVEQLRQDLRISEMNRVTFLEWLEQIGLEVGLTNKPGYSHAGVLVALDEDKKERATLRQRREALEADKSRLDWLSVNDKGTTKIAIYQNGHAEINPNGQLANWFVGNTLREALDAAIKGADNQPAG